MNKSDIWRGLYTDQALPATFTLMKVPHLFNRNNVGKTIINLKQPNRWQKPFPKGLLLFFPQKNL